MTGEDFQKLAGELFAPYATGHKAPGEALFRTVVSRSYYGAYHLVAVYLVELGFPPSSDHGIAQRCLVTCGDPSGKEAGRLLQDLYSARQRADYRLGDVRVIRDCQDANFVRDKIEWAYQVKSLIELCRAEPKRSAVKSGIETFLLSQSRRGPTT